jgi:phosphatidate cytidylyltransferase
VTDLHASPSPSGSLPQRTLVGLLVAGGFAALCWADATAAFAAEPGWWLAPLAVAIAAGGAGEVARMAAARGLAVRPLLVPVAAGLLTVVPLLSAWLRPAETGWSTAWLAGAMAGTAILLAVAEILTYRPAAGALARLVAGFATAAAIGLPLGLLLDLRLRSAAWGVPGLLPLASMLAVVKGGDIAAYLVGSRIGRRRMAPALSPGKTWEGAAASLAASLAVAWGMLAATGWAGGWQPWGGWPVYGLVLGVAGMLGDLAESLVKRELGAKDSGRSLGALGGFLDLADAVLFAAPVAWMLWMLGGPPA